MTPVDPPAAVQVTGLVLAWVGAAALVALVAAVQLQVRVVEEPYLRTVHGAAYETYAARTGRFVPGLGRTVAGRTPL